MQKFKKLAHYTLSLILGLTIPVGYVVNELLSKDQELSFLAIFDYLVGHKFFMAGAVIFPIISFYIFFLIKQIESKNKIIQEEFEYLKVLLNANPDAIIFLNEDQEIIFQNNQFNLLFDKYSHILKHTSINHFFNQVEFIQKEVHIDSNISSNHPFLMSFKLTKFQNRKNYFISFQDLKSLKDKEEIIEDQKHQMIEKNKLASLGEMAAGIGHEVNNPLTVIHSNNSIIKRLIQQPNVNKDRILKLTDKTKNQIERITNIITSLRNLSRGLANEEKEVFALGQLLEEAISLAKIRDKSRRIIFQYNNQKFDTYGNRAQVVQVILNLLNNAIDAIQTTQDPWISMELKDNGKYVDLYITDSGRGITRDIAEKIFIPMYTTKEIGKGTGLGLSLSKTFIEQNAGTLEYVDNQKNTCFKVSLLKDVSLEQADPAGDSAVNPANVA